MVRFKDLIQEEMEDENLIFSIDDRGGIYEIELRLYDAQDYGFYDDKGKPYFPVGECEVVGYEYRKKLFDVEKFEPLLRKEAFGIENLEIKENERGKGYGKILIEKALFLGEEVYNTNKVDIIAEGKKRALIFDRFISRNYFHFDYKIWYIDYSKDKIINLVENLS